jgi:tryptophan 2,3-dioxygenase
MDNKDKIYKEAEIRVEKLAKKYAASGQDLISYLDGLLHANYLTYWEYIHLDTLLTLQTPRTDFEDEKIFVLYHQITELYFNAILHELAQIKLPKYHDEKVFLSKIKRLNRYMAHLISSFDIMIDGMDLSQFLKFRMSLLPASGFQSVQFRKIEIASTDFWHLLNDSKRANFIESDNFKEMYEHLYWKKGANDNETGHKTLTLKQFERKYSAELVRMAKEYKDGNVRQAYLQHYANGELNEKIVEELRKYDALVNIDWRLAHYKSAVRYLQKESHDIAATGGTNWQKYLPPRFQKQIFFPELWSETEKNDWGKSWVVRNVGTRN